MKGSAMRVSEVMKAAVLFGRDDLRVVEAPVPKPEKDELLIRVHACGICGTDPHIISNGWRGQPPFGEYIPGHEYAGEVVRLGESVDEFKIGDRVASEPATGCNRCENCVRGLYTICLNYGNRKRGHRHIGFTANGGYAEYTVAPVRCLHPIPGNITYEEATMVTTAGTSLWGIERIGGIGGGDSVVVIGPGAIGLIAQQAAKAFGAGQVIVTGTRDSRLELAKRLGADHTINVRREDPVAKVNELTGGLGADVVLWCAQSPESAAQAVQMAKLGSGRISLIGIPEGGKIEIDGARVVTGNITLAGSRGEGGWSCRRAIQLMAQGRIRTKEMITHVFPLDQINRAFEVFTKREGDALKVVVKP